MKNSEVFDLMLIRLGFRKGQNVRDLCVSELAASIKELENNPFIPWFLEEEWTGVLVSGVDRFLLPEGWLREYEEGSFRLQLPTGAWTKPLNKTDLESLRGAYGNVSPSLPKHYAIFGGYIYLGPVPDTTYNYSFPYLAKTSAVPDNDDEVSNPWLGEGMNMVLYHALTQVALGGVGAKDKVQNFNDRHLAARTALYKYHESRQHTNRDYTLEDVPYGS